MRRLKGLFTPVAPKAAVPALVQAPVAASEPAKPPSAANRKKILLVDDDPIILRTTSHKLTSFGYTVVTAAEGAEAIRVVRKVKPDLLLLDISFPPDVAQGGGVPWNAFLIISWLRRFEKGAKLPVIIITGSTSANCREQALASGAVGFFTKPIDHDALRKVIQATVGG